MLVLLVQEITLAGVHVRTIGTDAIDGVVVGVAASVDAVVVSTSSAKKAWMFDMASGDLMRSFQLSAPEDTRLCHCFGIRFSPDGRHILVTDRSACRVSLFTFAGDFVRSISVSTPYDVDFAPNGDVLVVEIDTRKHCIAVYSPDGCARLRFFGGGRDSGPGMFDFPRALATHGDALYVLDNARVQVFQ